MSDLYSSRPGVLVISLGGTIAMTRSADGEGVTPSLDVDEIVSAVPELAEVAEIRTEAFRRIPGAHLSVDDISALADFIEAELAGGDLAGAVITQGTDTIEETAFLLDLLLTTDAPVVVTGAMRNPTAASADGVANLLGSVRVAASPAARGLGALVVFNDEIHSARFVQKTHTSNTGAFVSSLGPLGWVSEGKVRVMLRPQRGIVLPSTDTSGDAGPVALLTASLEDDGRVLAALPELGYAGAVIEALGGGHVPPGIAEQVDRVSEKMPVVIASRVGHGEILRNTYDFPGSELDLERRGAMFAGWLDGPKARILLTVLLRAGLDRAAVDRVFNDLVSP